MDVLETLPHGAEGEAQELSGVEDERDAVVAQRGDRSVVDARDAPWADGYCDGTDPLRYNLHEWLGERRDGMRGGIPVLLAPHSR